MRKKRFIAIIAFLVFAISIVMVAMKMRNSQKGDATVPTTDIQQTTAPQPLKASIADKHLQAKLRQLFVEAEEWVADVEQRRVEAQGGDQRMGYGAAVDAAEDAISKLETYKDSMTVEQRGKLQDLHERLEE